MPMFNTYRERYEYLKDNTRIKALRECFEQSGTILPINSYEKILDVATEAILANDDMALEFIRDELRKCYIALKETIASSNEKMLRARKTKFDPLLEAIDKEQQRSIPAPLLVRLEEDAPLRACIATIVKYPGATTMQICRTLRFSASSWNQTCLVFTTVGLAKGYQGTWRLTEFGERVLEEYQTKRLLSGEPSNLLP